MFYLVGVLILFNDNYLKFFKYLFFLNIIFYIIVYCVIDFIKDLCI